MRPSLLLALALLVGCGQPKPQLHVFTWPDYIDPQVVADFEREFACRVTVDFYEDVGMMQAKLAAGGASSYDIVLPGHGTLPGLIRRGLVAELRRENIPNLRHIDPRFLDPVYDPGNRHSVPYAWGTVGIYLRKSSGQPIDETWGLIFDPAKRPGPVLLLEDIRYGFGAALHYQGHRMNTGHPDEIARARDLLIATKKNSLGIATSSAAKNRVLAGDAAAAIAYSNDALAGMAEDAGTAYFIPREGGGQWLDVLSIPAQAPHRDLAEKFINYLLEPRAAARNANFARAATPNRAALEFINPADRPNPGIYPGPDLLSRLEYAFDLGETNRLYEDLWTQVKAK